MKKKKVQQFIGIVLLNHHSFEKLAALT